MRFGTVRAWRSAIGLSAMLAMGPTRVPAAQSATRVPSGASDGSYWCPMHPDQQSEARGKCPVCGMALVKMPPATFATYPVDLRATATSGGVRLRLAAKSPSQTPVRRFAIVHEQPMHLFVVGDGLRFFAHEHPRQQADGAFVLDLALPHPGLYMAIAEFTPEGATAQMFQQVFATGGAVDAMPPPDVDVAAKVVEGMRVAVDTSKLRSGEASTLAFHIEDAMSGADVIDLEPYLGARAHMLIVSADLTEAIHGHPVDDRRPGVTFTPIVPRAGRYKLWLQVQRRGVVSTIPFVIEVP